MESKRSPPNLKIIENSWEDERSISITTKPEQIRNEAFVKLVNDVLLDD